MGYIAAITATQTATHAEQSKRRARSVMPTHNAPMGYIATTKHAA